MWFWKNTNPINQNPDYAKLVRSKHAFACASGSAAVHLAVAAINPEPGDEIVTTAITDMGALTPILFQGAIPVFCDVDPETCNVTAADIEKSLSSKTKAIIVTHMFGNPCEMEDIMSLARQKNLPVIEDSAQGFMATYDGKYVGTIGNIGCFSLQQGKHITAGEGGLVVCDDDAMARHMNLFINKAWGYGDKNPDHYFAALNYRLTELQGAVALAQLKKLDWVAKTRVGLAQQLTNQLTNVKGIRTPKTSERAVHTYWKYCLRVDSTVVPGGPDTSRNRHSNVKFSGNKTHSVVGVGHLHWPHQVLWTIQKPSFRAPTMHSKVFLFCRLTKSIHRSILTLSRHRSKPV